jgi:hypothetical protein
MCRIASLLSKGVEISSGFVCNQDSTSKSDRRFLDHSIQSPSYLSVPDSFCIQLMMPVRVSTIPRKSRFRLRSTVCCRVRTQGSNHPFLKVEGNRESSCNLIFKSMLDWESWSCFRIFRILFEMWITWLEFWRPRPSSASKFPASSTNLYLLFLPTYQ